MSLFPRISHITPYGQRHLFLQWTVEGLHPTTGALKFKVERSSNHFEDFVAVADNVTDVFLTEEFTSASGESINLLSTSRQLTYRVGLYTPNDPTQDIVWSLPIDLTGNIRVDAEYVERVGITPQEIDQYGVKPHSFFYKKPALERRLILVRRAKMRRTLIALRHFTGTDVAILKRRHFGERCPYCTDETTFMSMQSRCDTCYGTSWVGGFFTPIITQAKIFAAPIDLTIQSEGNVQIRQARIGLPPFPVVEPDDIIVELDNDRRWLVRRVDERVFKKRLMKQTIESATEIGRAGVEYQIPADPRQIHVLNFLKPLAA